MKSYLKFLSRNKLYTAIEFVGLAVSLAFVIIIGSYVWQQFSVTRENPNRENIYLPGLPGCPGLTYAFPDVITEIPEIETVSRFCEVAPTYGKNEVLWGAAVDRQFFDLLPNYRFVPQLSICGRKPRCAVLSFEYHCDGILRQEKGSFARGQTGS